MNLDAFRTADPRRFRIAAEVRYADLDPNVPLFESVIHASRLVSLQRSRSDHARYLIYLEEARLAFQRLLDRETGLPEQVT